AIFSLILAASSEDQKAEDSAFLQKFLRPLNHDISHRYGVHGQDNRNVGLFKNEGILRNGYYDYLDDNVEDDLRNEGKMRHLGAPLYNEPNIWGYSRNGGGLGGLVSHAYNGEPNIWGYLRNNEARLRNEQKGYSRNEGRRISDHRGLQNLNALLEPEHIGYVGYVEQKGHKERYNYKLIGRKGLGFDRRTAASYGLTAPLTPSLLAVVGHNHYNKNNNYYQNSPEYHSMYRV
ncbi:jg3443, partial [Pararge aegeria aegeria]